MTRRSIPRDRRIYYTDLMGAISYADIADKVAGAHRLASLRADYEAKHGVGGSGSAVEVLRDICEQLSDIHVQLLEFVE